MSCIKVMKMKANKSSIVILVLIGLLIVTSIPLIVGISDVITPNELRELIKYDKIPSEMGEDIETVTFFWWDQYESPKDLYQEADLVVHGIISDTSAEKDYESFDGDVYTIGEFTITKIYKGISGMTIFIVQEGGSWNGINYISVDDPVLEVGEEVILFLRHIEEDRYVILGGPQGRFIVEDGNVYSLGEIKTEANVSTARLNTQGTPIEDFITSIR